MNSGKVFRFIVITFLMSWTLALVFYLTGLNWIGLVPGGRFWELYTCLCLCWE